MEVTEITPEDVTEAITPDTTPTLDTPAAPAPSSQKRKRQARALPPYLTPEELLYEQYAWQITEALRRALKGNFDRLTIEVTISYARQERTPNRRELTERITTYLPRYDKYAVVETDDVMFQRKQVVETCDEALAVIADLRPHLKRNRRLQVMGLNADERTKDGIPLLQWDAGRS